MAALTGTYYVNIPDGRIKKFTAPLAIGQKAFEGGQVCVDSANPGAVYRSASGSTTLKPIGTFMANVDNSAGGTTAAVGVELNREVNLTYWDSVTGAGAVTASNLFSNVYIGSDHEVTTTSTGNSVAGFVWKVLPNGKVGVEFPF
jgi:hypothetical protein